MRTVAIIQARVGSTRLPGKVLADIGGATMLARVVQRARQARLLDETVIATTAEPADAAIAAEGDRLGAPVFRGDEQDVLDRYLQAAAAFGADAVVRITADCPLIESEVIDRVVHAFLTQAPDYASNVLVRTYPRGLDTEVMTRDALIRAWREATDPYQRAHVTPYLYENPRLFRLTSVTADLDRSGYRWTVDTPEDLEFVRAVYARLGDRRDFSWTDVLGQLAEEPELAELNRHSRQKVLQEG